MKDTKTYNELVQKMRTFFQSRGFLEVPTQSRLSILAACENPHSIVKYKFDGQEWPLPQTGQMWLEYELLKNPEWNGVYCISTSYRDEKNPILVDLKAKGFNDPVILNILKTNINKYINGLKSGISTDIATVVNNKITNQQVEMVQTIRKINYVNSGSDGKILENGSVKIYNLTSNLDKVETDYFKVVTGLQNFNTLITNEKILPPEYKEDGSFTSQTTDLGTLESKRFFTIVGRIFSDKNKLEDFKKKVMTQNLLSVKKPKNLNRQFDNIVDDLADTYKDEIKEEDKFFEKFKKSPEYKKYTTGVNDVLFKKSLPRIVNFTTVPNPTTQALKETNLKNLYAGDPSKINDLGTFDGKIKFN